MKRSCNNVFLSNINKTKNSCKKVDKRHVFLNTLWCIWTSKFMHQPSITISLHMVIGLDTTYIVQCNALTHMRIAMHSNANDTNFIHICIAGNQTHRYVYMYTLYVCIPYAHIYHSIKWIIIELIYVCAAHRSRPRSMFSNKGSVFVWVNNLYTWDIYVFNLLVFFLRVFLWKHILDRICIYITWFPPGRTPMQKG